MTLEEIEQITIGDYVDNALFRQPRQVRHIRTNNRGKLMIGIGLEPTGFLLAKDCEYLGRKRKRKTT